MADVNIPITGALRKGVKLGNGLLSFKKYGVKKLDVRTTGTIILDTIRIDPPGSIVEYPAIGASLPCVFTPIFVEGGSVSCSIHVAEYGNQPDPDYFNITGVDDFGNPVYSGVELIPEAPEYTEREGE